MILRLSITFFTNIIFFTSILLLFIISFQVFLLALCLKWLKPLLNHSSCIPFMDDVYNYLTEEVWDGHMSGPLSCTEVESTLCGPFFSSPLLVSVQPQAPGTSDKIRMCKNLSKAMKTVNSINSHILKASFPTRFDTASRVADIVSLLLLYFYTPHPHFMVVYTLCLTILYTFILNLPYFHSIHDTPYSIHNTLYSILLCDSDIPFSYCACTPGHTSMHLWYHKISLYLPSPPWSQTLAGHPRLPRWILHWTLPSFWAGKFE